MPRIGIQMPTARAQSQGCRGPAAPRNPQLSRIAAAVTPVSSQLGRESTYVTRNPNASAAVSKESVFCMAALCDQAAWLNGSGKQKRLLPSSAGRRFALQRYNARRQARSQRQPGTATNQSACSDSVEGIDPDCDFCDGFADGIFMSCPFNRRLHDRKSQLAQSLGKQHDRAIQRVVLAAQEVKLQPKIRLVVRGWTQQRRRHRRNALEKLPVLERHLIGECSTAGIAVQYDPRHVDRVLFDELLNGVFDEFGFVRNPTDDLPGLGSQ